LVPAVPEIANNQIVLEIRALFTTWPSH